MDLLNNFSTREKNLWSEFLVDVAVALYYFPKVFLLMRAGGEALTGAVMAGVVVNTVFLAIFIGVVLSIFLHTQKKPEQVDERDHLFEARGSRIAYGVLVACMMLLMGNIVVLELLPEAARERSLVTLNPVAIAHMLLLSLMLSSAVKTVSQLFFYRRGY